MKSDIYIDNPWLTMGDNKVIAWAWVYDKDKWEYRRLTQEELDKIVVLNSPHYPTTYHYQAHPNNSLHNIYSAPHI